VLRRARRGFRNSDFLRKGDYSVKPDLKNSGHDQLSVCEGLVVGRKGYGEIQFLEPVDLTGLPKLGALLGEVIRFDDKECRY
jgi:nuclear pore complex protein Nup98-Nup96